MMSSLKPGGSDSGVMPTATVPARTPAHNRQSTKQYRQTVLEPSGRHTPDAGIWHITNAPIAARSHRAMLQRRHCTTERLNTIRAWAARNGGVAVQCPRQGTPGERADACHAAGSQRPRPYRFVPPCFDRTPAVMTSSNSFCPTGFARKSSMPAARHRLRSSAMAAAVKRNDNGPLGGCLGAPASAGSFITIHHGHVQIHEHQVVATLPDHFQHGRAVFGHIAAIAIRRRRKIVTFWLTMLSSASRTSRGSTSGELAVACSFVESVVARLAWRRGRYFRPPARTGSVK